MATTKLLYLTDSYLKESSAKISQIKTDGKITSVTLNQTIFYPQGGGQPCDQGTITAGTGKLEVINVLLKGAQVVHLGRLTGSLKKGDQVNLGLAWDRRYQHMQWHTAGHLLDEVVKELLPEHHGVRAAHGLGKKWFVTFTGFIDLTHKAPLQRKLDELIKTNHSIETRLTTLKEIEAEGIFLPFKLPQNKPLRLIRIGERDWVPDGGTQLRSTGEIGPITITKFEYQPGETTIHYEVKAKASASKPRPKNQAAKTASLSLSTFEDAVDKAARAFQHSAKDSDARTQFLGKKGQLNQLSRQIPQLPASDRGTAGKLLNQLKLDIEQEITQAADQDKSNDTWLDVTLPAQLPQVGHLHLISQAIDEIEIIFSHLGFIRRRYPEIETDWYYAEGLNIPKDHPARDDQETFYFSDNVVLTAHTSNGQLREMERVKEPPIKMINIGRTYRRQASATHSPMFHQFEGLWVDSGINMSHLVGVSNYFVQHYFGPDRSIRLRPHHFQFTEPSFEVDINCHICQGRGVVKGKKCRVCKSGWLELGGAGMVHPVVLKNGGIDAQKYSGFAFGWGVERIIMMKHEVTDNLRQLYTDDLRFLRQT